MRRPSGSSRPGLRGRLIRPNDDGYDEARAVFYGGFDRRPELIVRVADARTSRASSPSRERRDWSSPFAAAATASPATAPPTVGFCSIFRG